MIVDGYHEVRCDGRQKICVCVCDTLGAANDSGRCRNSVTMDQRNWMDWIAQLSPQK
jgi:hypothetical protein